MTEYMKPEEKARLQRLVTERHVRKNEPCPMNDCKGHLVETYPVLMDWSHEPPRELPIMVLRCSRGGCKFRGIVPERFTKKIHTWQTET